ncbi:MAG: hypothetical protein HY561_08430 [Gemmatimonadetes bacterium]|nr:hypothetical protein [Gemmatimonadota bacterium]
MIVFYVLLGFVLLRFVLVLLAAALLVRPVTACPACFRPSLPIQRAWLARLAPWFEWRWCPHCGWQALARRRRAGDDA